MKTVALLAFLVMGCGGATEGVDGASIAEDADAGTDAAPDANGLSCVTEDAGTFPCSEIAIVDCHACAATVSCRALGREGVCR